MKKRIIIATTLLAMAVFAFAIPPTTDLCIDPNSVHPNAVGYCNNISETPTEIILFCQATIGGQGQQKSCIGNAPQPL